MAVHAAKCVLTYEVQEIYRYQGKENIQHKSYVMFPFFLFYKQVNKKSQTLEAK